MSPKQARKGKTERQIVWEGVSFLAGIRVSPDRRFVRIQLTEKAAELQDILKVKTSVLTGQKVDAEVPFLKSHSFADGGRSGWRLRPCPRAFRPRSAKEKDRWWVLCITPRIVIEEEERVIREGIASPILREVVADVLHNPRLKTTREFYGHRRRQAICPCQQSHMDLAKGISARRARLPVSARQPRQGNGCWAFALSSFAIWGKTMPSRLSR